MREEERWVKSARWRPGFCQKAQGPAAAAWSTLAVHLARCKAGKFPNWTQTRLQLIIAQAWTLNAGMSFWPPGWLLLKRTAHFLHRNATLRCRKRL